MVQEASLTSGPSFPPPPPAPLARSSWIPHPRSPRQEPATLFELRTFRRAILTNADLKPSTPWSRLLENDFWGTSLRERGSHGSYRPLCVATYRLNYLMGGLEPLGYHVVNVALHALCTALVVRIAKKVSPPNCWDHYYQNKDEADTHASLLFLLLVYRRAA
jgi:hypothetical protein